MQRVFNEIDEDESRGSPWELAGARGSPWEPVGVLGVRGSPGF